MIGVKAGLSGHRAVGKANGSYAAHDPPTSQRRLSTYLDAAQQSYLIPELKKLFVNCFCISAIRMRMGRATISVLPNCLSAQIWRYGAAGWYNHGMSRRQTVSGGL
jgi:hypothetical protein